MVSDMFLILKHKNILGYKYFRRDIVKLCPECDSDNIERSSSTGFRIFISLILIFIIPFGFLFCWVPFVLAHRYRCKHCFSEGKEASLVEIDWRDREKFLTKNAVLERTISPFVNKWFEENQGLYKVIQQKGLYLLVEIKIDDIKTYKITGVENNKLTVEDISVSLPAFVHRDSLWKETDLSRGLLTTKELKLINESDLQQLKMNFYKEQKLHEEPVEIIKTRTGE